MYEVNSVLSDKLLDINVLPKQYNNNYNNVKFSYMNSILLF